MLKKKKHPFIILLNILIFFSVFIFHSTDIINIGIKNAVPFTVIPLITAFSMFNKSSHSAAAGLILGICLDGVTSNSICFNAVVLMLSATFLSVLCGNLFNRNIRSAILLCIITSLVYFLLRWLIFYAFTVTAENNLTYLLSYAFPSVIYTSVFIFPFYFIYRHFFGVINS